MTALPLSLPAAGDVSSPVVDEPVALLQLDANDPAEAASAVYREVRRGRRVVAVACGRAEAPAELATALDALGVAAVVAAAGEGLLREGVAVVPGPPAAPTRPPAAKTRPLRVALAGCGVVGGGVLERLQPDPSFEAVGVLVRSPDRPRDLAVPRELLLTDPAALLAREPDVLIEAISEASTGLALIRAALARGVDVISANKQAVGADLPGLLALADGAGARLAYSACVGGGAPLIETVRRARAHGPVARIEGVLNGTCNFLLNRLSQGENFDAALAAARAAGFAEEDPTADLSGADAAAKLAILAHEAGLSLRPDEVATEPLAPDHGPVSSPLRQIARLDRAGGRPGVRIEAVGADALFRNLPDEWNALRVTTRDGRTFTARGRGAGRVPTAESVWADLADLRE